MNDRLKFVWLAAVALTVIVVDQYAKFAVLGRLTTANDGQPSALRVFFSDAPAQGFDGYHFRSQPPVVIVEGYLQLKYAENPGAAFGLFRTVPENLRGPLFHLVSIGAVLLISYYFAKLKGVPNERWAKWGLPLVLGGAIGNYVDRLARGFVIDFIDAHWLEQYHWPAFNIADSAIVVGVALLVIDSFVRKETPA